MNPGPDVIESAEEATPDWLTPRLQTAGTIPEGVSVTYVAAERVGTGQMGVCDRLRLTYSDGDVTAPATLILKLASPLPGVRAFMGSTGYAGEIGFYRDLAHQVSIRMAASHHAAHDREAGAFTLLLDDLAPAVQGDQLEGLTLNEAEVCMDELVGLHAPRWGDPTLAGEPALAHLAQGMDMTQNVYVMVLPGFLERFEHVLDGNGVELLNLLTTGTNLWRSRGPSTTTLVHGDYRPDNLLINRSESPPTIAAVDWQGVRASAGQIDVAFLLATSVDPDVLALHEDRLLRRWYDGLIAAGIEERSGEYTWESCREDYRWAAVAGLQTTIFGAAFADRTDRGEDMFVRMITGQVRQILELDGPALLRE